MVTKQVFKKNNGLVLSDTVVALLIMVLFAGIIISLITNIVVEAAKIRLNSQHIYIATEILEHIEEIDYEEDVTEAYIIDYCESNFDRSIYTIDVDIESYRETDGNTDKLDLIKTVTLTIKSFLHDEEYQTQISRVRKATMTEVEEIITTE